MTTYWNITMSTTRTLCVVLMDLMHVWMILSFVFCLTHLMAFLSIHKGEGVLTPLSEIGAGLMRSTRPLRASQALRAHGGAQAKDVRAHYHQLHSHVLENILCQIRISRPRTIDASFLDPQQFEKFREKIPTHSLLQLNAESRNTVRSVPAENRPDCNVCHD